VAGDANDGGVYEVYAVRYARHDRTSAENFIGGDPHDGPMPMDYFVWLVRNAQRSFVVDTGFNAEAAQRRGRELIRCPAAGLKALGADAARVRDVIVTHLHYDHIGNFDLFANATFHLQDKEMHFATGRHMGRPDQSHSYDVEAVVGMVREVYRGRVRFYDGEAELAPGLSVHHVGGHTLGLQVVRVRTARGFVVLASDASHFYANMRSRRPFPIVFDVDHMVAGWDRCVALADSADHVVPGHDPEVMRCYPAAAPGLEGLAVRLDVPPHRVCRPC
jgi:glyoxylase-like metal-dependent hydrolase (beta-lactamase superfamily II)